MDTQTQTVQPDMAEIQKTVHTFWRSTGKAINIYKTQKRGTAGGFFTDPQKFASAAFEQSERGDAPAVFMSLQVLIPGCEGNEMVAHVTKGFNSEHVEFYAWLLIDCDPVRADGMRHESATNAEKARAFELAALIRDWLKARGYESGLCDSGNGYHVYVPVDVATQAGKRIVPEILKSMKARFQNSAVEVDDSVGDPAQVIKIYGTVARKGTDTPERPHRLARIVDWPEEFSRRLGLSDLQILLAKIKAELPALPDVPEQQVEASDAEVERTRRNLITWMKTYEISYEEKQTPGGEFPYRFFISCPFEPKSDNPEKTFLFPSRTGAMSFYCSGACRSEGRLWKEFEAEVKKARGCRHVAYEYDDSAFAEPETAYGVPPATANTTLALEGKATTNTLVTTTATKGGFKHEKVKGGAYDYVFEPLKPEGVNLMGLKPAEGWFPRGNVSLIGGASGTGKTSWIVPAIEAQAGKKDYFGHKSSGLPYLIVMRDRGGFAMERTLNRLGCSDDVRKHIVPLRGGSGVAAVNKILEAIESAALRPAVVVIDGLDFLATDQLAMNPVVEIMDALGRIAEHYHIAFIGTVGAPKKKKGEAFVSKRDELYGSSAWARTAETIVHASLVDGEGNSSRREFSVLHRNTGEEVFKLIFNDEGRLEVDHMSYEIPVEENSLLVSWAKARHTLAATDASQKYWTAREARVGTGLSKSTVTRQIEDAKRSGLIKKKPGPDSAVPQYTIWAPADSATHESTHPK